MPPVSFDSLAVVLAVAFLVPLVLGLVPRLRVPSVVVEIVAGIVVGPQVLGWAEIDEPVRILSVVGLAVLLFLAGLEIDTSKLRGRLLRVAGVGFAGSVVLALVVGGVLDVFGIVRDPLFAAVVLLATSLGLVIPVLREAGSTESTLGQLVILGSSIGDFAAVILLSLLFSTDTSDTGTRVTLLVGFALAVAVLTIALSRRSASMRIGGVLLRLQDTTAQIRVRGSMLLLIVLVVIAENFGLETILGAFVAGVVVGFLDRAGEKTHPLFHVKLDAIGYGFLVPIFFVASGLGFDLNALLDQPTTLLKVPLFLAAMLLVRAVPAVCYRSTTGTRGAIAAGLLQATSLPFIVAATQIGVVIGAVTAATAAAFVAAGLVSALVFPVIASGWLRQPPSDSSRLPIDTAASTA
jgi:Kef-type K+ transport system membrane component KefB